jgi:hypothetical protein
LGAIAHTNQIDSAKQKRIAPDGVKALKRQITKRQTASVVTIQQFNESRGLWP